MFEDDYWGAVDGDINADAIATDRKEARRVMRWATFIAALPFIPCLVWYGMTGSHVALAIVLFELGGIVSGAIADGLFGTHTFVMIVERRSQLLEQKAQRIEGLIQELLRREENRFSLSDRTRIEF